MLAALREYLDTIKEIVRILLELGKLIKQKPGLFVVASILYLSYLTIDWWAYTRPGHAAVEFVQSISDHNFQEAWNLLDKRYRNRRWGTQEKFSSLYSTASPAENFSITVFGETEKPFSAIFSDTLKYDVNFETHERFTKKDLEKSDQRINAMWVQIHHTRDYSSLMNGTLGGNDLGSNPSLAIRRKFRQVFVVSRQRHLNYWDGFLDIFRADWKVSSINISEQGLMPIQDQK